MDKPCFTPLTTTASKTIARTLGIDKALGIQFGSALSLSLEFGAPGEAYVVVRHLLTDADMARVLEALRAIPEGKQS